MADHSIRPVDDHGLVIARLDGEGEVPAQCVKAPKPQGDAGPEQHEPDALGNGSGPDRCGPCHPRQHARTKCSNPDDQSKENFASPVGGSASGRRVMLWRNSPITQMAAVATTIQPQDRWCRCRWVHRRNVPFGASRVLLPPPCWDLGGSMDRVPSALVVTPVLRLHQAIYRGTRGWIGKRLIGRPSLLLTTLGRRTGRQRTNALIYYKDGSSWVVVASNSGSDHGPGWLANLRTEPDVRVQVGRRQWAPRRESQRLTSGRGFGLSSTVTTAGSRRSFTPEPTAVTTHTNGVPHARSRSSFSTRPTRQEFRIRNSPGYRTTARTCRSARVRRTRTDCPLSSSYCERLEVERERCHWSTLRPHRLRLASATMWSTTRR